MMPDLQFDGLRTVATSRSKRVLLTSREADAIRIILAHQIIGGVYHQTLVDRMGPGSRGGCSSKCASVTLNNLRKKLEPLGCTISRGWHHRIEALSYDLQP
jgi:hypothetical protein